MSTIHDIKTSLQLIHSGIDGVVSTPLMIKKIETAQLPCVLVRTGEGVWNYENTREMYQTRTFFIECLVSPVTQDILSVHEETVDMLIERFGKAYAENHYHLGQESWIIPNTIIDSGIQVIDFGILYIGFVFQFEVEIRR